MPQRRSLLFGSLFATGLVLIAWTEYYPTSPIFAVLGMPGPRANSHRACREIFDPPGFLSRFRVRNITCNGTVASTRNFFYSEGVVIDGLSRKIVDARRMWAPPDSSTWQVSRDSIAARMIRLGGHKLSCFKPPPEIGERLNMQQWRFRNFFVRLNAYRWDNDPPTPRWALALEAFPDMPRECITDVWNIPPPEYCNADAVFRMPLPGNREFCVRSWLWQ